jgi:hypothetical protein
MDPTHWCHRHRWFIPQSDGAPKPRPKGSWHDSLTWQTQYLQAVQAYTPTERETPALEEEEETQRRRSNPRGHHGGTPASFGPPSFQL